jgi:hypothetical protein
MSTNQNIAKLLGWKVVFVESRNRFIENVWELINESECSVGCYYCEEDAWSHVPDFAHSLDACARVCEEKGWKL